jgi:hypothetical protein
MDTLTNIKQIIYNGTLGPSPFNIQALKYQFDQKNNIINVFLDEDRAYMKPLTSEHTFKEHCIGAGGSIENIRIAAANFHYSAKVEYCPDKDNRFHLAKIELIKEQSNTNSLFPYIKQSWSSRFKMTNKKIKQKDLDLISQLVENYEDYFKIEIITNKIQCLKLAKLSARAETMNWSLKSTQSKHRSYLKFSENAMKKGKDGIGVWEFGMPKIIAPVAKGITQWPVYKFLIPFGIAKYVGWSARMKKGKTVNSFLIVILKETEDLKRWLIGGELLQKILLETTRIGINHQWFSSIYIWDDVINGLGDINQLSIKYQNKAENFSTELRELLSLNKNDYVLAALGFGYANKPVPPKYRRELEQVMSILK